jgi:glycosyltransferase involved in cell wall biosynthesis
MDMDDPASARAARSDDAGPGAASAPVSVIVPCFRCAATIRDAIGSVVAQTLRPAEVLLVDDGSGDDTLETLHRIAAEHAAGWIKVIPMPINRGVSVARNVAWEHAAQPYIALLDADDTWGPRKLELQMAALAADPDIALIGTRMIVRPRGTPVPELSPPIRTRIISRRRVLFHNPFPTTSLVLRRDLPVRFDPEFKRSGDYLLCSRIHFSGYRCAKINQVLGIWHARLPGAIGLSDDYLAIHGFRRVLRKKLLREGLISWPEYLFARAVGIVSRLRRQVAVASRRWRGVPNVHG